MTGLTNKLFLGAIALTSVGFVYQEVSPFFLNIATVLFLVIALINLKNFTFSARFMLVLPILWLLGLVSGFWSPEKKTWTDLVVRQLPLFIIPLGFLTLPLKSENRLNQSFVALILLIPITLFGLATCLRYFLHFEAINMAISESKSVPVWNGFSPLNKLSVNETGNFIESGVSHIYFSILQGFAVILSVYNFKINPQRKIKLVFLIFGLINVLLIHLFLARTGLIGLYAGAFAVAVAYIIKSKNFKILPIGIGLIALVFFIAYISYEPVQRKVENIKMDLLANQGSLDKNDRSMAMRIEAWKTAVDRISKNPIIGYGLGQSKQVMDAGYIKRNSSLRPENRIGPHNQYLETFLETGIFGLFLLVSVFILLFRAYGFSNYLITAIVSLMMVSMIFESILQRQLGIHFVSFVIGYMYYFFYPAKS
jgi:O-antigen ligase